MAHVKGFTIIEVLMAVVLLTFGIVVHLQLFSKSIFTDSTLESSTTALYLAQEKMEEIKDAATYAAIDTFASARANMGGDFADFDRQVTVAGDPKQVNVIVYWTVKGQEQNINLVSLFADCGYD